MRASGKPILSRIFLAAALAGAALLALLTLLGLEYYALPTFERPYHPYHFNLRPSGRLGLLLALLGTTFMFLNLTYLVRKRASFLRGLGTLRSWMGFHVFTGLIGPGMIVLHTAFEPRSELGILSLSTMLVIVLTGAIGRYIYASVPRSLEGHELEHEEVRRLLSIHRTDLEEMGMEFPALQEAAAPPHRASPGGFLGSLANLIAGNAAFRREYRLLRRAVRSSEALRAKAPRILPLLKRLTKERMWLERYRELRSLMGSWRFFHRWLALLMLAVVLCHVVIAFMFGDLWVLRGSR